jgi:hypothetical protein
MEYERPEPIIRIYPNEKGRFVFIEVERESSEYDNPDNIVIYEDQIIEFIDYWFRVEQRIDDSEKLKKYIIINDLKNAKNIGETLKILKKVCNDECFRKIIYIAPYNCQNSYVFK